jgi:hypothetical protein
MEFTPPTRMGIVIGFCEPFTNGRTTNVVDVWFEGGSHLFTMKFGDLQF